MRHLRSLRSLKNDGGCIHHLLEEAENERMHLFTFLEYKKPSFAFRSLIILGQGAMFWSFGLAYMISPKTCHRFVGYLEDEAVTTYTQCLEQIERGSLRKWKEVKASPAAKAYWRLPESATLRDVVLVIRADECVHREVNHHFSDLPTNGEMEQEEELKMDEVKIPSVLHAE